MRSVTVGLALLLWVVVRIFYPFYGKWLGILGKKGIVSIEKLGELVEMLREGKRYRNHM